MRSMEEEDGVAEKTRSMEEEEDDDDDLERFLEMECTEEFVLEKEKARWMKEKAEDSDDGSDEEKPRWMEENEELKFRRQWKKRQKKLRGIIVVSGPPYTYKTKVVERIGKWVQCPVLSIEDFFSPPPPPPDDIKKNAAASDKVDVIQHAFTNLCKVARRHLEMDGIDSTVVIKSRLSSTIELQRLLDLVVTSTRRGYGSAYPLLIIQCRFTNEYIWKQHFEYDVCEEDDCSWYRPRSLKEMEEAMDEYYHHPQSQPNWDLHLQQLILQASSTDPNSPIIVRRLVVDPIYDILSVSLDYLPNDFRDAIEYLLTAPEGELISISQNHPYNYTVEFSELRPYLFEKRLCAILASKGRSNDLCLKGECIFKYWEELIHNHVCGVCDKQVDSGTPAYACRLCILTLHKSCAERIRFRALRFNLEFLLRETVYETRLPKKHACKSCMDAGKGFYENCGSCVFQTHLKCGVIPTIINHNSHPAPHFLSLLITKNQSYKCRACGDDNFLVAYSYCCKPCGLYYHLKCALLPLQLLKHEHGGHEHVMKLMYSHHETDDGMEPEESYWCDVCYEDMDPESWCYSCQNCPYYVAHLECAGGYEYFGNLKYAKFVPQIQSQLEDAMAEVDADSEIRDKE